MCSSKTWEETEKVRFVSWKWGLQLQRGRQRQRSSQDGGGEGCPVPGASCASLESSLATCSAIEIIPHQCPSTNRVLFKGGNLDPDTHREGDDADAGKDHHLQPRAGPGAGASSTLTRSQPCPLLHGGLQPGDWGENTFLLFEPQPVLFVVAALPQWASA